MAENNPGFGDLLNALGSANPFAPIAKTMSQFQRGVSEFMASIENFNRTMEQFNRVASRVNGLLDLVEEPIKAFVPQVTRTARAADQLVEQLSAPIDRVAPGLNRLAETLSAPVLANLPKDLGEFVGTLGDLARRLQPLGQMAETAGGLFAKSPWANFLPGATAQRTSTPRPDSKPQPPSPARNAPYVAAQATETRAGDGSAAKPQAVRKPAAKKAAAKKSTAKRTPAKKTAAKKAAAKKATKAAKKQV